MSLLIREGRDELRSRIRRAVLPSSRRLIVLGALLIAATAAASLSTNSTEPAAAASTTICTRPHLYVFIDVRQYWTNPAEAAVKPNGCWSVTRVYQNAGRGNYNWKICHNQDGGPPEGTGANRVFEDTSPVNSLATETALINQCGNLHTEYMALRPTSGGTWRRNAANVSVARYAAELYKGTSDTDSLWSKWMAGGYGASQTNSFPMINIQPNVYSAFDHSQYNQYNGLYYEVHDDCVRNPKNTLYIYSGSTLSSIHFPTQQSDVETTNAALNDCTGTTWNW